MGPAANELASQKTDATSNLTDLNRILTDESIGSPAAGRPVARRAVGRPPEDGQVGAIPVSPAHNS